MTDAGFWAMGYIDDNVFRQHGWTEVEAKAKVRSDMLRHILTDFLRNANLERAMFNIERTLCVSFERAQNPPKHVAENVNVDLALNFIEQIALRCFPESEVNGEIIGEAQDLLSKLNAHRI